MQISFSTGRRYARAVCAIGLCEAVSVRLSVTCPNILLKRQNIRLCKYNTMQYTLVGGDPCRILHHYIHNFVKNGHTVAEISRHRLDTCSLMTLKFENPRWPRSERCTVSMKSNRKSYALYGKVTLPISYRFRDIASYLSKVADFNPPHFYLAPPSNFAEVFGNKS